MKVDMLMPQMGESIAEATISKWLKNIGDQVEKDEVILEISTDKVDSEIPAPASGVITALLFSEGDVVPVKEKIAEIDTDGSAAGTSAAPSQPEPQQTQASSEPAASHSNGASPQAAAPQAVAPQAVASNPAYEAPTSDRFYSPLVKGLAAKHGVPLSELDRVPGTGQGGRLTKQDFLEYVAQRGQHSAPAQPQQPAPPQPPAQHVPAQSSPAPAAQPPAREDARPAPSNVPSTEWQANGTKVVPMDNMRRAIAEHMVRSKQTSPHVYSVQEVDMTNVSRWRQKHKNEFKGKEGFNLSFTPFFLEAAVRGLQKFPYVNCSLDGNTVILKKQIHLGCAVALGTSGLIVPVIKNADERNLVGLARSLSDLALRARNKQLMPDDIMGGTFTVTNPGIFGTMIGTPIINQPQVAILCLGKIEKRPVVIDDMIAIREMCYLTLSYDHRIVDGALGGQFLAFVSEYLENWDTERPLY